MNKNCVKKSHFASDTFVLRKIQVSLGLYSFYLFCCLSMSMHYYDISVSESWRRAKLAHTQANQTSSCNIWFTCNDHMRTLSFHDVSCQFFDPDFKPAFIESILHSLRLSSFRNIRCDAFTVTNPHHSMWSQQFNPSEINICYVYMENFINSIHTQIRMLKIWIETNWIEIACTLTLISFKYKNGEIFFSCFVVLARFVILHQIEKLVIDIHRLSMLRFKQHRSLLFFICNFNIHEGENAPFPFVESVFRIKLECWIT